jgi:hypothetical protein
MKLITFIFINLFTFISVFSQEIVQIRINIKENRKEISPYIYGRNNSLSDNSSNPLSNADWQQLRDAGVTFFREGGGNNSTKYNWKLHLSSHPDWYNNVYYHNWDYAAQSLQQNIPGAQGMWSFQLLGKVAGSNSHNFNDWDYNKSKWWSGVSQNLAGGGVVNPDGGPDALVDGNPDLYLMNWTADSTVGILDHWFGAGGLGLDSNYLRYWNMDNEPEIWEGTHDDVMPSQESAESFMQRYFAVAKAARAKFPGIKLVGPVPANEWQWYNWIGGINVDGKNYPWLKYFIKRIAEEQTASGIRLLDVLDVHFYPSSQVPAQLVQYHRVYFDKNYVFPEANGIKTINGGWDNSINKEYLFERCREWLNEYMGEGHGVKFGVTETGIALDNPNVTAVWYASTLGEFMKNDVEIFSPWTWRKGMWEVLHLFSRYNKPISVNAESGDETYISAYPSVSADNDSLTLVLVNRSTDQTKTVNISFPYFKLDDGLFQVKTLSNLPGNETFISHTQNALVSSQTGSSNNIITLSLQPLSVTSLILTGEEVETGFNTTTSNRQPEIRILPNPASHQVTISIELSRPQHTTIDLLDGSGRLIKRIADKEVAAGKNSFNIINDAKRNGLYFLCIRLEEGTYYEKVVFISQ